MTKTYKTRSVSFDEFRAGLRKEESAWNAGSLAHYDADNDRTLWSVAGQIYGISNGRLGQASDYYIVTGVADE